jgi:hypothetical protein
MARYPSTHIYDYHRGDGWILAASANVDQWEEIYNGHCIPIALYYTDEQRVETHDIHNTKYTPTSAFFRQFMDIGAKLGSYPGASPEINTDYEDQPRAVRMQRHATDIYRTLGNAKGLSETMAVRAAEEFGAAWDEKTADDWADRVKQCGDGTANSIELKMKQRGLIE